MGKKKSNSRNAARVLESLVSPIVEINYEDPLFAIAAHPTRPILVSGLVTGHVYCNTYDSTKLEESQSAKREQLELMEKEAFKTGKISQVNRSVSQLKQKWWTRINDIKSISEDDHVVTNWKTKRHKGSCRHAIFDPLEGSIGENIYTVGTDNLIKKAAVETGKVVSKLNFSSHLTGKDSVTKLCHSQTHPFLLSTTEDGHVLVFDSKNLGSDKLKFKVDSVHDDAINHILPMSDVSAYHYLTLGSTTMAHIDIRKGVINQSDDQEDELLSMCYANDTVKNDMVLVSHGEGIVTIWKNSKNRFQDQLTRIKVNKSASIDAIIGTMNQEDEELASSVWCGDSEGLLHRVNYKQGKVVETRAHSSGKAVDEVGNLDIDYEYRLISAGMESLKIWSNQPIDEEEEEEEEFSESEVGGSDVGESDVGGSSDSEDQRLFSDDSEIDSDDERPDLEQGNMSEDDVSDANTFEENLENKSEPIDEPIDLKSLERRRRNFQEIMKPTNLGKKTINLNKSATANSDDEDDDQKPSKKQKLKKKQMTTKQLSSLQKHEHGIRKFDGL